MNNLSALTMTICRVHDKGVRPTRSQTVVVFKNALHYIPQNFHGELILGFLEKLKTRAGFYYA